MLEQRAQSQVGFPTVFSHKLISCVLGKYFRKLGPVLSGKHTLFLCAADWTLENYDEQQRLRFME